jgi:solute carrier family 35 (UDP-sugar transporter), member A1/2/3
MSRYISRSFSQDTIELCYNETKDSQHNVLGPKEPYKPFEIRKNSALRALLLKNVSLLLLVAQTTAVVTTMHHSRRVHSTNDSNVYINTTAVFFSEIIKFGGSLILFFIENQMSLKNSYDIICNNVFYQPYEFLKISIPAILYTLQNNLTFIALTHLPPVTYQVTYQMKILTTALLSVILLKRTLGFRKWVSLFALTLGVTLSEWSSIRPSTTHVITTITHQNHLIGLLSVFTACLTSALAGVYFEKLIKTKNVSVWLQNVQLAFFSFILAALGIYINDYDLVKHGGVFQGYNTLAWIVVLLNSLGGLIVALVLKYADNLLKCFANALALIFSLFIAIFITKTSVFSFSFLLGGILVITASFCYSLK